MPAMRGEKVLNTLIQVNADDEERGLRSKLNANEQCCRNHHTFHKITIKVNEISNLGPVHHSLGTKLWYTIKAASRFSSKPQAMGKIESKKISSSDPRFDTAHEILVDIQMVRNLVVKLKQHSRILGRKVNIGSYTIELPKYSGSCPRVFDDMATLRDSSGNVVGEIRLFVEVSPTDLPALHYAPQPFYKASPDIMSRQYTALVREGQDPSHTRRDVVSCSLHRLADSNNIIEVVAPQQTAVARQHGQHWNIAVHDGSSRLEPARKFVLECWPLPPDLDHPDSPPMEFCLSPVGHGASPDSGRGSVALLPGNLLAPNLDASAAWGVWTLVRDRRPGMPAVSASQARAGDAQVPDVGRVGGGDVIGVIHVAGPCVECRGPHELGLAVAVGNAMLWACVLHGPGRHSIQRLISRVARRPTAHLSAHGTAQTGRGFLPLAPTDDMPAAGPGNQGFAAFKLECLETRMKLGGVGRCGEREEEAVVEFLGGGSWREETGSLASGALVAKELDWCGGTFLGFAIF